MTDLRLAWDRTFRELPEKEVDQTRTGVAFVAVLFSLVIGKIADGVVPSVRRLINNNAPAVHLPGVSVAHYVVALVLTVTSFVGYFASKNGPQLRIKFFNLPFVTIVLDSTMVITYFFLAIYAESGDVNSKPDARPEAVIVTISLLLYAVWDWVGHRLRGDLLSQLALGRQPSGRYGARRLVTLAFFGLFLSLAITSIWWNTLHTSKSWVICFDILLILLLLLYRVCKSIWDAEIKVRTRQIITSQQTTTGTASTKAIFDDWKEVVPAAVSENRDILIAVAGSQDGSMELPAGDEAKKDGEAEVLNRAVARLSSVGAISISVEGGKECATLTKAGKAYVDAYDPP
jgi:hypothetical protein